MKAKPIRHYEPCPVKHIKRRRSALNTICNDLRDIYAEAELLNNEKIMLLSRLAFAKAKSMMKRLWEYHKEVNEETFFEEK